MSNEKSKNKMKSKNKIKSKELKLGLFYSDKKKLFYCAHQFNGYISPEDFGQMVRKIFAPEIWADFNTYFTCFTSF